MRGTKPTIVTVAELAGVSTATVRRVLYGEGHVKASTRQQVEQAVKQTAYRPNVFARGLRTSRSSILALVTESELNPFFMKVAKAVQTEALSARHTVLMLNHNGMPNVERMGIEQFLDHGVAAVIFCAAASAENVDHTVAAGVRAIQIEREVAESGHALLVDARVGMTLALQHLRQLGHERVAYIGGIPTVGRSTLPIEVSNEALRVAAFREAMSGVGLAVREEYLLLGRYFEPKTNLPSDGARMMKELLSLIERPTAVIIGSDFIAAGALQAVYSKGLRIPDDLSVIGYDDSMAAILSPPLTTIAQPMDALGRYALEWSLASAETFAALPRRQVLETSLFLRKSTSSPRVH